MPPAVAGPPAIAGPRAVARKPCTEINGPAMGACVPQVKFEFFALALTGSAQTPLCERVPSFPAACSAG
jgi:hypothetical protein